VAQDNVGDFLPWVKYPELTKKRLSTVAALIRIARESAVLRHDPASGDGPWGLGCSAYERTCFAIEQGAAEHEWLSVLPDKEQHLRFAFAIGHIPFRLYRGEPGDPPSRYLATSYAEIHQRQLALDFGVTIPSDGILRLAVETDATGRALRISLVELNEARQVIGSYVIPFEEAEGEFTVPLKPLPVDLPAAALEPLQQPADEPRKRSTKNASGQ
jgi:hypothetical protein